MAVPSFGKVFPIYPGITRRSLSRRGERKRIRFTVERLFTGFNNGAHPTSSLSLSLFLLQKPSLPLSLLLPVISARESVFWRSVCAPTSATS